MQIRAFVAGPTNTSGEVHLLQRQSSGESRQGRYVLGELLGRGGMAEVFAGQSLGSHGFQKPCAIKRLLPELANDNVFVERLWKSVKYERVYVYAYDSVSEARWSIMPYMDWYNQSRPHSSLGKHTPDEA